MGVEPTIQTLKMEPMVKIQFLQLLPQLVGVVVENQQEMELVVDREGELEHLAQFLALAELEMLVKETMEVTTKLGVVPVWLAVGVELRVLEQMEHLGVRVVRVQPIPLVELQ